MNAAEILIYGPVMGDMAQIVVEYKNDFDKFHIYFDHVEDARTEGSAALLELVLKSAGARTIDILAAAKLDQSPILFEGEDVSDDILNANLRPTS